MLYIPPKSNLASITSVLEQNKEEYQQLNQKKDLKIEELSKVKDQQAKTLVEMHAVANERESSLTSEMERYYSDLNNYPSFIRFHYMLTCIFHFLFFKRKGAWA